MSNSFLAEDPAVIRAALVSHLAVKLAPLYKSGQLRSELADWLAPLSTTTLSRCLRQEPGATADALAAAVLADSVARSPQSAIADVIAVEYPKISDADRCRLVAITEATRKLAHDNDGTVTVNDLFRLGFGVTEYQRWKDRIEHVLAVVDGRVKPRGSDEVSPSNRLLEVGVRASARRFNSPALACSA